MLLAELIPVAIPIELLSALRITRLLPASGGPISGPAVSYASFFLRPLLSNEPFSLVPEDKLPNPFA